MLERATALLFEAGGKVFNGGGFFFSSFFLSFFFLLFFWNRFKFEQYMISVKQQETLFMPDQQEFYRRSVLENGVIVWERPSQYGTFTCVTASISMDLERKYGEKFK